MQGVLSRARATLFGKRTTTALTCSALVFGYCWWLLTSVNDLGYARDEGFYFAAADSYLSWFEALSPDPADAISQAVVDKYWRVNHEHPALIKSLFGLSRYWLFDRLGWFHEPGTSYRFVGMALSSVAIGVVYLWGTFVAGRVAGLMAALLLAFIPRVFYHAHLDCFDMPVASLWLLTSYIHFRSLGSGPGARRWGLSILAGVLYGLLLNTKHNSWLLPFALVPHILMTEGRHILKGLWKFRVRAPLSLWLMAALGPVVFVAGWPWLWFDTAERFSDYVAFHTQHVYYNMEFLGRTYFEPPFPRSYAWLMTFATVPFITLLLGALGFIGFSRTTYEVTLKPAWRSIAADGIRSWSNQSTSTSHGLWSAEVLWCLCILVSYAPWVSSSSPIFGGTKHWITAYPFFCLFAGVAFSTACSHLRGWLNDKRPHLGRLLPVEGLMASTVLLGPLTMTANSHPWGLSAYTPLVGGAPGAASLGLNRSFWGYTTGAVQEQINELAPKRAKVFIHDTAMQSWRMMVSDGRLRRDVRPQLTPAWSKLGIYHHEQHMSRVEHQIWVEYGTVKPAYVGAHDGVPVVWLYERGKASKQANSKND